MLQEKRESGVSIYVLPNSPEKLNEYDFENIDKLNAEWFVYWYEIGSYDGDGFAVWKKDDKYYYSGLGHCSCYGPTESIKNAIGFSLEEVEKIAKTNYDYSESGKDVIKYIKENLS